MQEQECGLGQLAKTLLTMQHGGGTMWGWIDHAWRKGREFPGCSVAQLAGPQQPLLAPASPGAQVPSTEDRSSVMWSPAATR
jgi:hypothetical protein